MRIAPETERGAPSAPAFDFKKVRLFIGIPTRGTCATQFAVSIARSVAVLTKLGTDCQFWRGESDCLVDFNRNKLLAEFVKGNFTHCWMVDDDMGFDPSAIIHMLRADKDFIAAAGPKKGELEEYAVKIDCNSDGTPQVFDGLFKASIVGGAFILLEREAVQELMWKYPGLRCSFVDKQYGYSLFQNAYSSDAFMTEDYTFCKRWREAGKEIFIYPNVDFTHTGIKEWKGNLHKQLLARPEEQPSQVMVGGAKRLTLADLIGRLNRGEIQPKKAPPPIPTDLLEARQPVSTQIVELLQ